MGKTIPWIEDKRFIAGDGVAYSMNCYETHLNNNTLIVGTSGAGKTRSVISPNILQATGSYVISDPKGSLYSKYGKYLAARGYDVQLMDFTNPDKSARYNFFKYIRSDMDVVKIAHMLCDEGDRTRNIDPFWDDMAQTLLESLISFVWHHCDEEEQAIGMVLAMLNDMNEPEEGQKTFNKSKVDDLFDIMAISEPDSFAVRQYKKFKSGAVKTRKSILITAFSKLRAYEVPQIKEMMSGDEIDIPSIGDRKRAIFVVVSDTDRSMDQIANLFFSQAMNELCYHADQHCENQSLPVPVRFILDDFATNVKIDEFPRMIASIRSRNISAVLSIQAEGQLTKGYGPDDKTIIANCDTYIYMGGSDVDTANQVAARCDVPLGDILYMPIDTSWVFRRGSRPVYVRNFNLEGYQIFREKFIDSCKAKEEEELCINQ